MCSFYAMLYTVYPRAGDVQLPQAPAFNDWASGMETLVKLAFLGEAIDAYITAEVRAAPRAQTAAAPRAPRRTSSLAGSRAATARRRVWGAAAGPRPPPKLVR
eukprot:5046839-Prymnesium_polylepis.1